MSHAAYFDQLFERGCGWLGWSPEAVLDCPLTQLHLALQGRVAWARLSSPFGGGAASDASDGATPTVADGRRRSAKIGHCLRGLASNPGGRC
tara:strand:+ start:570 stop:845 length:276 start_codon:yes stop_codon:yes gene_type:complete